MIPFRDRCRISGRLATFECWTMPLSCCYVPDDAQALAGAVRDAVISTLGVGNSLKSSGLIARLIEDAAVDDTPKVP